MRNIADSGRLIALDRLPVQPMWISGSRAYAVMSAARVGAMIAKDGDLPLYFVSAKFLRAAIEVAASEIGLRSATVMPVSSHLARYWNPNGRLFEEVAKRFSEAGFKEVFAAETIGRVSVNMSSVEPESRGRQILSVADAAGLSSAWYFGADEALNIIQTPPPKWYCEPYDHENGDPDTGQYHECGGKLKI
jgi:hypothetical protein